MSVKSSNQGFYHLHVILRAVFNICFQKQAPCALFLREQGRSSFHRKGVFDDIEPCPFRVLKILVKVNVIHQHLSYAGCQIGEAPFCVFPFS